MLQTLAPRTAPAATPLRDQAPLAAALLKARLLPKRRQLRAGQAVYRAGENFHVVYFLQAGCVKTVIAAADGRERVTGFHLRGELLGMEALGSTGHSCDAIALEDGEVWEIPVEQLFAACASDPQLQRALTATLAAEIRSGRGWMLAAGTLGATQRVAALLLELGRREAALGYSASHLVLRMTRADIGSLLGLTLETVTRALTQLKDSGLISVERRDIVLRDRAQLEQLVATPARLH